MARKKNIEKHTLNLREGDYGFLQEYYATEGATAASIIRMLTAQHVDKLRTAQTKGLQEAKINVEDF